MQFKLALPLGRQRDQPRIVRTRTDLAKPDLIATHEEFNTEQSKPSGLTIQPSTQVIGDRTGNLLRASERDRRHRLRLPAFDVITADLQVADWLAKVRFDQPIGPTSADCEKRNFVLEIDKALNNHTTTSDPTAMHRMTPCSLDLLGPIDSTLPLTRTTHHRFNDTGIADSAYIAAIATLPTPLDRLSKLVQRIAELIRARRYTERLRGKSSNTFPVHRQTGSAGSWHHPNLTFSLKDLQFCGRDRFNFGYDQHWAI